MKNFYAINVKKWLNGWNTMSYDDYEAIVWMQKNIKKIHRIVSFPWMMYVYGRKSKYIFQKFIIINVLRAMGVLFP